MSDKVISKDFVELSLTKKNTELLKHLLKKEQKRERRRLRKVKKLTNKKEQNNFIMEF